MAPPKLHSRYALKPRRRQLRRRLTPAEATLWRALKKSQLADRKFRRQHSVGKYVLDFYCVEEWLAVELDGQVHKNYLAEAYDEERTIFLKSAGIKVLRFENYLVFEEPEYVLHRIKSSFGWKESTTPSAEAADTPPIQEGSFWASTRDMAIDTVTRFSNRVANYVKYRPGYPPEVVGLFKNNMGLTPDSIVADIGSGTGLSAKPFLENGNTVYGVEPNSAMREAAEEYLKDFPNFISHDGTAENTNLNDGSMDFVIAAQAFHWFDPDKTRAESQRVLKPGGYIALIWNERQLDANEFLRQYEKLLLKFANDYEKVRHENIDEQKLGTFFQTDYQRATFQNEQVFDFAGLRGRVLSSSYMPAEGDASFPELENELSALFTKHSEHDRIKLLYDTNIYYKQY